MNEEAIVYQLGALLLIVYTILATGYYSEAARWSDRVNALPEGDNKIRAKDNVRRAEFLFRICSAFMMFALICTVLPFYLPFSRVAFVCKWALVVPMITLIYACGRFLSKRYWVHLE